MAITFIDDIIDNDSSKATKLGAMRKKPATNKIHFVDLDSGSSNENKVLKGHNKRPHSSVGFIVAIILLSITTIAGSAGMFFWAKGRGWDEAISSFEQKRKEDAEIIENARKASYDSGFGLGVSSGKLKGYDEGFEDARRCAELIIYGVQRSSIYDCHKNQRGGYIGD